MGAANSTSSLGLLLPDVKSLSSIDSPAGEASPTFPRSHAALALQKAYRGYRTRRRLADSAVLAEELWWQVIDYARLNHSTISFFNFDKPESAASRWHRVLLNASKVGQGLSKDAKAQKLAFQHWIEAIDPRHRYGHNLHIYYEEWCKTDSEEPFFFWLDIGDGRDVDLKECPRSKLRSQCIKYLGPQEREHYEYILVDGKILHKQSQEFLDTTRGSHGEKWIFVVSTSHKLYAGVKKKGAFHHSSFLAGGATLAAGRLVVQDGILKSISPYSGHYRPTNDSLDSFLLFLKDNGLNLDEVQIVKANEDSDIEKGDNPTNNDLNEPETLDTKLSSESDGTEEEEKNEEPPTNTKNTARQELIRYLRSNQMALDPSARYLEPQLSRKWSTKSGGLPSPMAEVPKHAILERINSKKATRSYQLGDQLSRKWSTGAGPRIGCINDYPPELKQQALEIVNLSPGPPSATPSASATLSRIYAMKSPSPRTLVL